MKIVITAILFAFLTAPALADSQPDILTALDGQHVSPLANVDKERMRGKSFHIFTSPVTSPNGPRPIDITSAAIDAARWCESVSRNYYRFCTGRSGAFGNTYSVQYIERSGNVALGEPFWVTKFQKY